MQIILILLILFMKTLMIQNNINAAFLNGVKKFYFWFKLYCPKITNQPINEESLLSGKLEPTNEPLCYC